MPIRSAIADQLGLKHPFLGAPMAGVAGGRLAAAVSRAGGLGFIGGGYGNRADLHTQLQLSADVDVGVGFITWALDKDPQLLDIAVEHGIKALFLSFGDIKPYVTKAHEAGIPLFAQVQTLKDAKAAIAQGADFIIAQGSEAGGHGATRGTLSLLPSVVDHAGKTPVVAAGGIADGRTTATAFLLGAQAVVCGTALFVAEEALSHPKAKDIAIQASGDDTVRSNLFDLARGLDWPAPYTLRALRNSYYDQWIAGDGTNPAATKAQEAYAHAVQYGDFSKAAVIVGEATDMLKKRAPAADIIASIMDEAEDRLLSAPNHLTP